MRLLDRYLKIRNSIEDEMERKESLHAQLEDATRDMEMKLCPTNDGRPCFRQCAHFEEGRIRDLGIEDPACKLWKY